MLPFALAQTAGAFVAALLVRWTYTDVIDAVDPGHTIKTQGIFSTLPGNGTLDVSTGTALPRPGHRHRDPGLPDLRGDRLRNNDAPVANLAPVVVGLIVVAIGMAWGTNAGYAINPARDFGPRLASFITGYGTALARPVRLALLLGARSSARSSAA